jgi:plastocyanin
MSLQSHTSPAVSRVAPSRWLIVLLLVLACLTTACGGGGATAPEAGEPTTGTPTEPPGQTPTTPTSPATPPAQPTPTPPAPMPPPAPSSPNTATISTAGRAFSPPTVTIAAGGTVTWQMVDDDHTVTFLGAAPAEGSIPRTEEGSSVSRTFPTAGRYDYECERHRDKGMRGTIVVAEGSSAPPPSGTPPSTPPATPPAAPPPSTAVTVTTPNATFAPATVTIPRGGTVTWQFSEARHNVTFQGAAPAGGNVPDTQSGGTASRTFATPGTYQYLCTRHSGMNGTVVVQ